MNDRRAGEEKENEAEQMYNSGSDFLIKFTLLSVPASIAFGVFINAKYLTVTEWVDI